MSVLGPKSRNAFVPRSLPGTLFAPSPRVPGGYITYMDWMLKEIVNVQAANLEPEEVLFVKARLQDWDDPVRPCDPPEGATWDASVMDSSEIDRRRAGEPAASAEAIPPEGPRVEELPENPMIRIDELVSDEGHEDLGDDREGIGQASAAISSPKRGGSSTPTGVAASSSHSVAPKTVTSKTNNVTAHPTSHRHNTQARRAKTHKTH